jgi:cell division protein FtsB
MKKSKYDKLLHQKEVLEHKIAAYERVRKAISDLVYELKDDAYALEALNAIDRTIFNQLQFMYLGLETLKDKIKDAVRSG